MKDRIQGVLFSRDAEAAFALLEEIATGYELIPEGFEDADQFEGKYIESSMRGLCGDCAGPYEIGETIFWRGTGKGVLCEGCRKTEEWDKAAKQKASGS